jgi:hypothetical protein
LLLSSKFNHKISLFKRLKASNFRLGFQNLNKFIFVEKEEEKEELEEELRKKKKRT